MEKRRNMPADSSAIDFNVTPGEIVSILSMISSRNLCQQNLLHRALWRTGSSFFPAEAKTAKTLRLQVIEKDTDKPSVLTFGL